MGFLHFFSSQSFAIQPSCRSLLLFFHLILLLPSPAPFPPSTVRTLAFFFSCSLVSMRAVQTQPVSSSIPWECYPTYCCVFSPFFLPPPYLFTAECLPPPIDCFIEDMSGLCLLRAQLYIDPSVLKDVLTHTSSLSQLVASQCPVVRLMHAQSVCCNHKVMIIGLSCHRRCVENVCASHFITADKHHEKEQGEQNNLRGGG